MPETLNPARIDLNASGLTLAFQHAPIYRKHSVVEIVKVPVGTRVETILTDGTAETVLVATAERRFRVTNPGGEQYLIAEDKRDERYEHIDGDRWQAKGRIRAFPSPILGHVVIDAPWGEPQYGGPGVMFAATIEDEHDGISDNRYLIGATEFFDTYRAE